ncbi:MAG: hypothetical protein ACLQLG_18615 [Thermoguttaceae bacterium]
MSVNLFVPLADAVTSLLNSGSFSEKFTATRIYDPLRPLETLETLRVDVVIGDRKCAPFDRSRQKEEPRIDVCIRQVVNAPAGSAAETAILDGLVGLMEEIDTMFSAPANRTLPPGGNGWARWQNSDLVVPFMPKKLRDDRLFYSLLRLNYLVVTDANP